MNNLPVQFQSPQKMVQVNVHVVPPPVSGKTRDGYTFSGRPNINPKALFQISAKNQNNLG